MNFDVSPDAAFSRVSTVHTRVTVEALKCCENVTRVYVCV
jgi:hypothetical protein